VGLIPYAINGYTRGVAPLKCFEYLAAGLAVVSTDVPAMVGLAVGCLDVTAVPAADLVPAVLAAVCPPDEATIARRLAAAGSHGWSARGETLRGLIGAP
jgi:hypothetical protein